MTASNGASYVTAAQLAQLGTFLQTLTAASHETDWRTERMVVSLGEGDEEILVGVRWLANADEYAAEIR